ncbi:MAG: putative addiction module antidote protein [Novosphingobium sp.]|nr:putative addiction module antidote protein [Novosphingobium sp.]
MTTTEQLQPFDPAEYLDTPEHQVMLLEDAFATGDKAYILNAIGIVARARGMTALQKETGLNRATLYAALSEEGNPTFGTMLAVLGALGLRLGVQPADMADAA